MNPIKRDIVDVAANDENPAPELLSILSTNPPKNVMALFSDELK